MTTKYLLASAFAVAMSLTSAAALADVKDYTFESVAAEFKKGDDVVVAVRSLHKPSWQARGGRRDRAHPHRHGA